MNRRRPLLCELSLRTAQRQSCVHRKWLEQREIINKLRTRELENVIKHGSTAKDDQLREAMERLYKTRGQAFSGVDTSPAVLQHTSLRSLDDGGAVEVERALDQLSEAATALAPPLLPPGTKNIRAIPRCPAAPNRLTSH